MTCHCGNCEDHRVDSWKMFDHDSVQWTEAVNDEMKDELFGVKRTKTVTGRNPRDNRDGTISPDVSVPTGKPPKGGSSVQAPVSLEELAWETIKAGKAPSKVKQDLEGSLMEEREASAAYDKRQAARLAEQVRRRIKLLTVVRGNNTFLQVWEGDSHVKEFKSGIGANEMAFFFEDMVIPFRDMFEELGFLVTEEISIE